jgi:hypothetical protein
VLDIFVSLTLEQNHSARGESVFVSFSCISLFFLAESGAGGDEKCEKREENKQTGRVHIGVERHKKEWHSCMVQLKGERQKGGQPQGATAGAANKAAANRKELEPEAVNTMRIGARTRNIPREYSAQAVREHSTHESTQHTHDRPRGQAKGDSAASACESGVTVIRRW